MSELNNPSINDYEEINIKEYLNIFYREKMLIIIIFFLSAVSGISYTFLKKPIWLGSFQIAAIDQSKNNIGTSSNNLLSPISALTGNIGRNHSKTKEIILKSPLILDPVYKNLKKSYKNENVPLNTKTFTSWAGNLDVNFEKGSDILFVKYKNTNKKLILDSLNLISKEYQKYSNRDSKKQIENSILYLQEQQQILKREADFAQKRLNKFNIENGLGDLDGFVSLGKNNKFSYRKAFNDNKSEINPISQNINGKSAGLRFQNQFALLEEYETEYIVKSSYYKPNAKTLKALKLKIENLRESLKRPNEILIKYKDLTKEVARLDNFLFEIENKLQSLKLRRAKNNEPWEIISTPILDESKLAPNSKSVILSSLFFGLIGGCILAIIKEKLSNKVYDKRNRTILNS